MRTRALVLTVVMVLAALLAACTNMPSVGPATVAPATVAPSTVLPVATDPGVVSPLPAPTVELPAASAPVTSTGAMTGTGAAAPAIAGTPFVTETVPVSPEMREAAPVEVPLAPDMSSYRDDISGFEMDYPATWSVVDVTPEARQQSTGYSITFMSWKPQEPGGHGIPEGGAKIDVSVTKGTAASPEAAAESRRQEIAAEGSGSEIIFEEPWELPGGLAATRWTIQSVNGEQVQELVTAINGNRIVVSGYGDASEFEQIAMTLRVPEEGRAVTLADEGAAATAVPAVRATEKVVVPMVVESAGAATLGAASTTYTVRQGDTLAKIAARFGVTVAAILKANPQITNPDHIYVGQRITIPGTGGTQPPAGTTRLNIYMIGLNGGSVGCGDQVVAVARDVPKTAAPLTAALNLMLAQKDQNYGQSGLYNALYQSNLKIASITRVGAAWTIRLTGTLTLGGVCDNPRVKAQLEQTALQFSTVASVKYFVNGTPLDSLLSGK